MKKIVFSLIITILSVSAMAQQTSFPYAPPTSISQNITVRSIGLDSLLGKTYIGFGGYFNQFYTAAQSNALFQLKTAPSINIYNSDGTLTAPRTVSLNGNYLRFNGRSGVAINIADATSAGSITMYGVGSTYLGGIYNGTNQLEFTTDNISTGQRQAIYLDPSTTAPMSTTPILIQDDGGHTPEMLNPKANPLDSAALVTARWVDSVVRVSNTNIGNSDLNLTGNRQLGLNGHNFIISDGAYVGLAAIPGTQIQLTGGVSGSYGQFGASSTQMVMSYYNPAFGGSPSGISLNATAITISDPLGHGVLGATDFSGYTNPLAYVQQKWVTNAISGGIGTTGLQQVTNINHYTTNPLQTKDHASQGDTTITRYLFEIMDSNGIAAFRSGNNSTQNSYSYLIPRNAGYIQQLISKSGTAFQLVTAGDSSIVDYQNQIPSPRTANDVLLMARINDLNGDTTQYTIALFKAQWPGVIATAISKGWAAGKITTAIPTYENSTASLHHSLNMQYRYNLYKAAIDSIAAATDTHSFSVWPLVKANAHAWVGADSLHLDSVGHVNVASAFVTYLTGLYGQYQYFNIKNVTQGNNTILGDNRVSGNEYVNGTLSAANINMSRFGNNMRLGFSDLRPFELDDNELIRTTIPSTPIMIGETQKANIITQVQAGTLLPSIDEYRSRGTILAPTAVGVGDVTQAIRAFGYDGSNYLLGGQIQFSSAGSVSPGFSPGNIDFYTRSSAGLADNMRIEASGDIDTYNHQNIGKLNGLNYTAYRRYTDTAKAFFVGYNRSTLSATDAQIWNTGGTGTITFGTGATAQMVISGAGVTVSGLGSGVVGATSGVLNTVGVTGTGHVVEYTSPTITTPVLVSPSLTGATVGTPFTANYISFLRPSDGTIDGYAGYDKNSTSTNGNFVIESDGGAGTITMRTATVDRVRVTSTGLFKVVGLAPSKLLVTASDTSFATVTQLPTGTTAITQTAGDGSTLVSTDAYADASSTAATTAFRSATVTLTNKSISGASNTITAIPNSALTNSTLSGVSLGSSLFQHLNGYGLLGSAYNGSVAQTWNIDTTAVTSRNFTANMASKAFVNSTFLPIISPTFSGTLTGPKINIAGTTSGIISVIPQAVAGTYNFNLPTTAGTAGQVLTSQGGGTNVMTWTTPLVNPMTSVGDIIYGGSGGNPSRIAGNTTSVKNFLTQIGTGSTSAAPVWLPLSATDIPNIHGNSTTTGTATTSVTVTIGQTMANTTYAVTITPRDLLTAVNYYISAQTTTTFTVTFVSGISGSINFDWIVNP